MQRTNEQKEGYPQNRDNRREEGHRDDSEPRNYAQPDPMNVSLQGKSLTVTLVNGRIESGICKKMGQYFMELQGSNGKTMLINKGQVMVVSVL